MFKYLILTPQKLILFQIYYCVIAKFLIWDLGFPYAINYISDFITLVLLVLFFKTNEWRKVLLETRMVAILVFVYYSFFICSSFCNNTPFYFSLWSVRNNFRFFLWILIVACFIDRKSIDKIFANLNVFILINLIVIVFQYVVLNLRDDRLNGLFGSYIGGNSAVNTFSVIMAVENIVAYFEGKRKLKKTVFNILLLCVTCAINEIKFFFIELTIILLVLFFIKVHYCGTIKVPKRSVSILFIGGGLIFVGYAVLLTFYPGFISLFDKNNLIDYLTRSYNSSTVLFVNGIPISNRLTAYSIINCYFLDSPLEFLFGIGLGAAEYSSFFSSYFWTNYGEIGINNYSFAQTFLETGFIGFFLTILIYLFFLRIPQKKYRKNDCKYYYLISHVSVIIGLLMNFYNSALRIESSGYMFFTVIALAFCLKINKGVDNVESKGNS